MFVFDMLHRYCCAIVLCRVALVYFRDVCVWVCVAGVAQGPARGGRGAHQGADDPREVHGDGTAQLPAHRRRLPAAARPTGAAQRRAARGAQDHRRYEYSVHMYPHNSYCAPVFFAGNTYPCYT